MKIKQLVKLIIWSCGLLVLNSCKGQNSSNGNFVAHITEHYEDGKILMQADTVTGFTRYYYPNGQLEKEGNILKGHQDSLWKYYSEDGLLLSEQTSNEKGKLTDKMYRYSATKKIISESYEYFEGDYLDNANFKFHRIEKSFYLNGQPRTEKHILNSKIIESKTWNTNGEVRNMNSLNSSEVEALMITKSQDEKAFIDLLTRNKIDSCLMFFSILVSDQYGVKKIEAELRKLNSFLSKYPNTINTISLGRGTPNGVGVFGHDNDGLYEKESRYEFIDENKKCIYFFKLYYSDREPMGIIKYFTSEDLRDF